MDPGRLGILLQMEAVVGIGSAALLTDEPFGVVEVLGTVLVVAAGVADIVGNRSSKPHQLRNPAHPIALMVDEFSLSNHYDE